MAPFEIYPDWQGRSTAWWRSIWRCANSDAVQLAMEPGVMDLAERDVAWIGLFRYWARAGFEEFNASWPRAWPTADQESAAISSPSPISLFGLVT